MLAAPAPRQLTDTLRGCSRAWLEANTKARWGESRWLPKSSAWTGMRHQIQMLLSETADKDTEGTVLRQ